ncbi:MAG: 30S ribosomal protein S2 [Alphaproteobacteria bacterium]|nr:30S ribosomal protein S2 [Alphaproteobacteria bacterium]
MALPQFTMRQLLEVGAHFGHQTHRWNPKMAPYIFIDRNGVHIIDLSQTTTLLHQALVAISDIVAKGGRVLFVGTKRQASAIIAQSAQQCAQYYMSSRWLGGTLTNWDTISNSIKRLKELESTLQEDSTEGLTKKEILGLQREYNKLERAIGGVKDMGGLPDIIVVIDTNKEAIAVAEAQKLNIPIIAVLDTNCNPDGISYPIPGNDDATRAIEFYCDLFAKAVLDGIEKGQIEREAAAGADSGESETPLDEAMPADMPDTQAAATPETAPDGQEAVQPAPPPNKASKGDKKPAEKTEPATKKQAVVIEKIKSPFKRAKMAAEKAAAAEKAEEAEAAAEKQEPKADKAEALTAQADSNTGKQND